MRQRRPSTRAPQAVAPAAPTQRDYTDAWAEAWLKVCPGLGSYPWVLKPGPSSELPHVRQWMERPLEEIRWAMEAYLREASRGRVFPKDSPPSVRWFTRELPRWTLAGRSLRPAPVEEASPSPIRSTEEQTEHQSLAASLAIRTPGTQPSDFADYSLTELRDLAAVWSST